MPYCQRRIKVQWNLIENMNNITRLIISFTRYVVLCYRLYWGQPTFDMSSRPRQRYLLYSLTRLPTGCSVVFYTSTRIYIYGKQLWFRAMSMSAIKLYFIVSVPRLSCMGMDSTNEGQPYNVPLHWASVDWYRVHWNATGMSLVDPVYTGIPLGVLANPCKVHWNTPLEKLWNCPTLECHWRNFDNVRLHWNTTGRTVAQTHTHAHIVKQSSIHVSLKWQDGRTPVSKGTGLCVFTTGRPL